MKKSNVLVCAFFMGAVYQSFATTVTWSGVPTARGVILADGTTSIASGSLVLAGAFSSTGFSFDPNLSIATNFSLISVAGGWKQFTLDTLTGTADAGTINTLTVTGGFKIGGAVTDNNNGPVTPTKADFFNSKQIYAWVFNATSIAAATQMGIFTATSANVPWVFPVNAGGIGDSITVSTQISLAPTMIAAGGVGLVGSGGNGTLQLVASTVPEPSVLALGGMAALGMLASRKRGMKK